MIHCDSLVNLRESSCMQDIKAKVLEGDLLLLNIHTPCLPLIETLTYCALYIVSETFYFTFHLIYLVICVSRVIWNATFLSYIIVTCCYRIRMSIDLLRAWDTVIL